MFQQGIPVVEALNDARADARVNLLPLDTKRWVARRKAAILVAINTGVLSRAQACAGYHISEIELRLWERAVQITDVPGLHITRMQIYKPIFGRFLR